MDAIWLCSKGSNRMINISFKMILRWQDAGRWLAGDHMAGFRGLSSPGFHWGCWGYRHLLHYLTKTGKVSLEWGNEKTLSATIYYNELRSMFSRSNRKNQGIERKILGKIMVQVCRRTQPTEIWKVLHGGKAIAWKGSWHGSNRLKLGSQVEREFGKHMNWKWS